MAHEKAPAPSGSSESLFSRMVAFVVLAAGVNLWTGHHLGMGLQDPKLLGGLSAILAGGTSLLDRIADKAARESFGRRIRGWLQPLLAWPVLVVLYLLAAVFAVSYSSVTVLPDQGSEVISATATAIDRPDYERRRSAAGGGTPVLIPLRVTAFGRVFRIEADGYLPARVSVPPLAGRRLQAGRDLQPLPSLLLRPPPKALVSLAGGGSLSLFRLSDDSRVPIFEGIKVDAASGPRPRGASFLVGRPQAIPPALQADWRLELAASLPDPARAADVLLQWSRPQLVETEEPLEPGMIVEAEVWTRAPKLKASAVIVVGTERLSDIPLNLVRDAS